jgi:hypothetical protein
MPPFNQETSTLIALIALLILGAAGICSVVCDVITAINLLTHLRAKKSKSEDDMLCHFFVFALRLILCTREPSV